MGSACELECETILSFDLAFITEEVQEQLLAVLIEVKRMLSGLIASLTATIERRVRPKPSSPGGAAALRSHGDSGSESS